MGLGLFKNQRGVGILSAVVSAAIVMVSVAAGLSAYRFNLEQASKQTQNKSFLVVQEELRVALAARSERYLRTVGGVCNPGVAPTPPSAGDIPLSAQFNAQPLILTSGIEVKLLDSANFQALVSDPLTPSGFNTDRLLDGRYNTAYTNCKYLQTAYQTVVAPMDASTFLNATELKFCVWLRATDTDSPLAGKQPVIVEAKYALVNTVTNLSVTCRNANIPRPEEVLATPTLASFVRTVGGDALTPAMSASRVTEIIAGMTTEQLDSLETTTRKARSGNLAISMHWMAQAPDARIARIVGQTRVNAGITFGNWTSVFLLGG